MKHPSTDSSIVESRPGCSQTQQSTRSQGAYFETLAELFLQRRGLKTIIKNFRKKVGEIDLIMQQAQSIVFIEVKFRRSTNFGTPLESINKEKIRRIRQVSLLFLKEEPSFSHFQMRFDVISILPRQGVTTKINQLVAQNKQILSAFDINWIPAAF